tara:strand:- start:206 stop:712 length:507 start_codon:yes stop_codon:yes gene_type:complete
MKIINKTVYKNQWFQVINKYYENEKKNYYVLNIPDSSVILPITKNNEFIIIKQFRESLDNYSLELPAGFIDENETPQQAAERELFEETGYVSKEFIYLGIGRLMINRTNSVQHLFAAKNINQKSKPKEDIEVLKISQSKLYDMISEDNFVQLSGQGLILKYLIQNKSI